MNKKMFKNVEWGILICCLILLAIGIIALFSATQGTENQEFKKQIVWALISIPIMIIVVFIDYNLIAKISPILYGLGIIALGAVLFTEPINGASSWFKISETITIQPSEFVKVILIVFLAYIIVKLQKQGRTEINKIWKLLVIVLACRSTDGINCFATRLWNSYGICCCCGIHAICCWDR
ncbi:FtsW/RodA/SpoVE family cell cycle protein [bacterium]|nr:FtsW/RodA/SpoVE family cell cycle protein [bacterium]